MSIVISALRTYRVSPSARKPLLDFMVSGLESSRCRIIYRSEPDKAPFVITFETVSGERIGVVAYAFRATRTPTTNRPEDERSFQVKYGDKKDNKPHLLWQDPLGLFTTIFVGISPDERVGVARPDPACLQHMQRGPHARSSCRCWLRLQRSPRSPHRLPLIS